MSETMKRSIEAFRAWDEPRDGVGDNPFRLACTLDDGADDSEIAHAWPDTQLPDELVELWHHARSARLFKDIDYGQWGLSILSPAASFERTASERRARPADMRMTDIVIAEFLGDLELLVLSEDEGRWRVRVALPLDPRQEWYDAAPSLVEFLDQYHAAVGDKFWE